MLCFNNQRDTTNKGWCVHDNLGRFIFAGIAWDVGTHSIIEAEAMALKEEIQEAISLNLQNIIFKSDSQRVAQAPRAKHRDNFEFILIITSLQNVLQFYPNFEVKFSSAKQTWLPTR